MNGFRHPSTFLDFLHSRKGRFDKTRWLTQKSDFKHIAKASSVRYAKVLASFDTIPDIDLADLPDRFVLKPENLTSAAGVFLITRLAADLYYDWMRRRPVDIGFIRTAIRQAEKSQKRESAGIIAEEFVSGENYGIPFDYKLYTFHSGVAFILQIDRNTSPPSFAFFDGNFNKFGPGHIFVSLESVGLGRPALPSCAAALLTAAVSIVQGLGTPFASVDMYATPSGPVLGEVTYAPGGIYSGKMFVLSDEMDSRLGGIWAKDAEQLKLQKVVITGQSPMGHRDRRLVDQSIVHSL